MTAWREVEGRSLYPILTHQNQRTTTVGWKKKQLTVNFHLLKIIKDIYLKKLLRQKGEGASWESDRQLTALMTVDTDNLAQRDGQCIVPVDTVPAGDTDKVRNLNQDDSHHFCVVCNLWLFSYLFSRSQSPSVPLISWLGVHFSVRLSPAWWRDK